MSKKMTLEQFQAKWQKVANAKATINESIQDLGLVALGMMYDDGNPAYANYILSEMKGNEHFSSGEKQQFKTWFLIACGAWAEGKDVNDAVVRVLDMERIVDVKHKDDDYMARCAVVFNTELKEYRYSKRAKRDKEDFQDIDIEWATTHNWWIKPKKKAAAKNPLDSAMSTLKGLEKKLDKNAALFRTPQERKAWAAAMAELRKCDSFKKILDA